ncbi:MAG: alpha/beta fold hydrolase [Chloroflexia bacterium]|nr:alpha/beta fold hydrolase [Chloroflexia bacterium]
MTARSEPGMTPRFGRGSRQFWRLARHLTPERLNRVLRLRSASGLPISRSRFWAMGLPEETVEAVLGHIRSLQGWDLAWTWAAQGFLGESRRHATAGRVREAAVARQHAALSYHAATIGVTDNIKKLRTLRAARTTLFSQALPVLMPEVTRVEPVWRASVLPGYLVRPAAGGPTPLVVLLNGSTTAKEETVLWTGPLVAHGLSVLCLDWPGTGESALELGITADCDDFTDGVIALARDDPALDEDSVVLLGFSLGGALAVQAAVADRRIAAVVAVSAPYDASRWLRFASPVMVDHLVATAGGPDAVDELERRFALTGIAEALTCPLLVVGAGADLVMPPSESLRLCAAAGENGTLLWFPDEGHGLYDAVEQWTGDVGRWVRGLFDVTSTPVDPAAALGDPFADSLDLDSRDDVAEVAGAPPVRDA